MNDPRRGGERCTAWNRCDRRGRHRPVLRSKTSPIPFHARNSTTRSAQQLASGQWTPPCPDEFIPARRAAPVSFRIRERFFGRRVMTLRGGYGGVSPGPRFFQPAP